MSLRILEENTEGKKKKREKPHKVSHLKYSEIEITLKKINFNEA